VFDIHQFRWKGLALKATAPTVKLQPARRKVCVFKVGAAHSLSSICDEWAAGKPTFFSGCIWVQAQLKA